MHKRTQPLVVMGFLTAWSLFWLPTNLMLILSLSHIEINIWMKPSFQQASWHNFFVAGTWRSCWPWRRGSMDRAPLRCPERWRQDCPAPVGQRGHGGHSGESWLDAPPPGLPEWPRSSGAPAPLTDVRGSPQRAGRAREDATAPGLRLWAFEHRQTPPLSGSRPKCYRLFFLHSPPPISWGRSQQSRQTVAEERGGYKQRRQQGVYAPSPGCLDGTRGYMQTAVVQPGQPGMHDPPGLDAHAPSCPQGKQGHSGAAGESRRQRKRQKQERLDATSPRLPQERARSRCGASGGRGWPKRHGGRKGVVAAALRVQQRQFPVCAAADSASRGHQRTELRKGGAFAHGCPARVRAHREDSAAERSRHSSARLIWMQRPGSGQEVWKTRNCATTGELKKRKKHWLIELSTWHISSSLKRRSSDTITADRGAPSPNQCGDYNRNCDSEASDPSQPQWADDRPTSGQAPVSTQTNMGWFISVIEHN